MSSPNEIFLSPKLIKIANQVMDILKSHGIKFRIIGGFAASHHSRARLTEDIDFLISEAQTALVKSIFPNHTLLAMHNADGFSTKIENIDVDFIITDHEYLLNSPVEYYHHFPVPDKKSTLLLKFQAGRTRDTSDIIQILEHSSDEELKEITKFFQQYGNNDMQEDLTAYIEIARLEKSKNPEDRKKARMHFFKILQKIAAK